LTVRNTSDYWRVSVHSRTPGRFTHAFMLPIYNPRENILLPIRVLRVLLLVAQEVGQPRHGWQVQQRLWMDRRRVHIGILFSLRNGEFGLRQSVPVLFVHVELNRGNRRLQAGMVCWQGLLRLLQSLLHGSQGLLHDTNFVDAFILIRVSERMVGHCEGYAVLELRLTTGQLCGAFEDGGLQRVDAGRFVANLRTQSLYAFQGFDVEEFGFRKAVRIMVGYRPGCGIYRCTGSSTTSSVSSTGNSSSSILVYGKSVAVHVEMKGFVGDGLHDALNMGVETSL
jgi:hypothetical protein